MKCPECNSENVINLDLNYPLIGSENGEAELNEYCIDRLIHLDRRCEDCGFSWNEDNMKTVNNYVKGFCKKALLALEIYDKRILENITNTYHKEFYKNDYKGLGLFGVCERDLQYIIVTELCRYYPIWPEYTEGYKNKQRLDIALSYGRECDENGFTIPDIAIELKWAVFNKTGQLYSNSQQTLVDDIIKMKRNCKIPNQYFMQLSITKQDLNLQDKATREALENDTNERINGNQFRNHRLQLNYSDCFKTLGAKEYEYFNMLLWKIEKTI